MSGKYRYALVFIGIFTISLISGCTTAGTKKVLIVQLGNDIEYLDNRNRFRNSAFDKMVAVQWQGFLARLVPGETIYYFGAAAEKWETNADQTEWTFTLREGVKFHDGTLCTARDVKYSFAANFLAFYGTGLIGNFTSGGTFYEEYYFNVTYPESDPDGDGLVFSMNGGWWPDQSFMLDAAGHWNLFMLVPEGSCGNYTDDVETIDQKMEEFEENPISTGPYKFNEYLEQEHIIFDRFDDWFGWGETFTDNIGEQYTYPSKDNAFEQIKFRVIPDPALAVVELTTGGLEVTTSKLQSKDTLDSLKAKEGFDAFAMDALVSWNLQINAEGDYPQAYGGPGNYPLTESWFRKALSHAVNRTNLIDNVYGGIGSARETFYPDWILDKFPNIDTADYYDFGSSMSKVETILDEHAPALGFANEPDNRFGYGPYLNETQVDGKNQTVGHHFVCLVDTSEQFKVNQAIAVKKDMEEVGIYIDLDMLDRTSYLTSARGGVTGEEYNLTYVGLGVQDPEFYGPDWDIAISGSGYYYETPQQYGIYASYVFWIWYAGGGSVLNMDYEIEVAKMLGGTGFLDDIPGAPDNEYPYPEWTNNDTQFVEAAEEAGRLFADTLQYIPMAWSQDTYCYNSHVINFLASRAGNFDLAYCYWE